MDLINDHCGRAATLSGLDLVGFDKNDKHSFPVILEYSNMEPWTLEHLYPASNMIGLRPCANLPAVKGLIQSAPPLNDCFIETYFVDVKSIYFKQNTGVTGCTHQCLE